MRMSPNRKVENRPADRAYERHKQEEEQATDRMGSRQVIHSKRKGNRKGGRNSWKAGQTEESGNGMASLSVAQRTDGGARRSQEHDRNVCTEIRRISGATVLPRGLSCSLNRQVLYHL
jgi:hypothetical protein